VGAFHGAEIPFLFDTHGGIFWDRTPTVDTLTDRVQSAWARFAAVGVPGDSGLPPWTPAGASASAMVLGEAPAVRPLPRLEQLRRFADGIEADLPDGS